MELFQSGMAQQVGLVTDEDRMLLLALIQTHDGLGDLTDQIPAATRRLEVQFARQLPQQIQAGAGGPVQVEDLVQTGIERAAEGAGGSGFSGSHFSGQQTRSVVIDQKLQSRLDLSPSLRGEQLLGIRTVRKRRFLKTEEGFPHRWLTPMLCFCGVSAAEAPRS